MRNAATPILISQPLCPSILMVDVFVASPMFKVAELGKIFSTFRFGVDNTLVDGLKVNNKSHRVSAEPDVELIKGTTKSLAVELSVTFTFDALPLRLSTVKVFEKGLYSKLLVLSVKISTLPVAADKNGIL